MSDSDRTAPDSVPFAGGVLDPYRHISALAGSREQEHRNFDPFVSEGLARGERMLHSIDPAERARLVRHLRHLGLDMPTLLGRRRCDVRAWSETYRRRGRFDQDAMLGLLDEFLSGSRSLRIRMVADM
jgi:hypothetical protein